VILEVKVATFGEWNIEVVEFWNDERKAECGFFMVAGIRAFLRLVSDRAAVRAGIG
jgi:hypothetical protein